MNYIKLILKQLWVLPTNIVGWIFYFLPQYIRGVFEKVTIQKDGIIKWDINNNSSFYKKMINKKWWGYVIGSNVIFIDLISAEDETKIKHEEAHIMQNYIFGPFFYPIYILLSLYVLIFKREKHSYYDNPFELQARKSAGQQINIPKEYWKDGPNDRWPWF